MDITPKQSERINAIASNYGLELVLLFGSRVGGKVHKESDFDVAYVSKKKLDFEQEYHLNYEFTKVFGHDEVDTVDIRKAPPLLMKQVFKDHQILFCSDITLYHRYHIYAVKRYIEAAPLFKLRQDLIKKYFVRKQKTAKA